MSPIVNRHPCPICNVAHDVAADALHRLCEACEQRRGALRLQIGAALEEALMEATRVEEAWLAYQAGWGEGTAQRWATLCATRNVAEGMVIALTRGRLARTLSSDERMRKLAAARERLHAINAKIARTRTASHEIATLLDAEARYRAERDALQARIATLRAQIEEIDVCDEALRIAQLPLI